MPLREPFGWWPSGRKGRLWAWVVGVATVGLNIALGAMDRSLQDTGAGILEFELARTFERSFEILGGWSAAEVLDTAKASVLVDFPFLVLYAVTLGILAAGLGRRLAARGFSTLARWAPAVGWATVAAAALDAAENVCLWLQLSGGARRIYALPAFAFASVKFALLTVVAAYLVIGGLVSLGRSKASQDHTTTTEAV